jgi:hypothetical protein
LTKVAETIITEDSGSSLYKRIIELEAENSQLKAATTESTEAISMLRGTVNARIKDYVLLLDGNKSLVAECDDFRYHCEDLQAEFAEVHSNAEKRTINLESKVKSAKAHSVEVAATDEKWLRDFEGGLVRDLEELRELYVCNAQTIGGLCSLMPEGEPLAIDYPHWLSAEISSLPDMFGGVNDNFVTAAIEGALVMAGDSVDLNALQSVVIESGAYILPAKHNVWRAMLAMSKKWRSFNYNYVLAAIRAKHEKVFAYM